MDNTLICIDVKYCISEQIARRGNNNSPGNWVCINHSGPNFCAALSFFLESRSSSCAFTTFSYHCNKRKNLMILFFKLLFASQRRILYSPVGNNVLPASPSAS